MAVYQPDPNAKNRPIARKDAQGNLIPPSFNDLSFRGDYTGTNLIYKAFARNGASESSSVWQIAKLAYDGSNNLTSIKWPQNASGHACNDYAFSYTDRATYTYS